MEKGIIFISVDSAKTTDKENLYRTGGWCVLKEAAVRRMIEDGPVKDATLRKRVAFVEDEVWAALGLPKLVTK